MKKLFATAIAVALCFVAGCSNDNKDKVEVPVDIQTVSVTVNKPQTNAETTAQAPETTEETKRETVVSPGTTAATRPATPFISGVKKDQIEGELAMPSKAEVGGSSQEGNLVFSNKGFVFTNNQGVSTEILIDSLLLVIVDYKAETNQEELILLTGNGQYKFMVSGGYTNQLSKYLIISEAQDPKSVGILSSVLGR